MKENELHRYPAGIRSLLLGHVYEQGDTQAAIEQMLRVIN